MAGLITGIIPPQQFELIRDRIAAILALELGWQAVVDTSFQAPQVFLERYVAPNTQTEVPCIVVNLSNAVYENSTQTRQQGTYWYYLDCYTGAASTDADTGDKLAQFQLQQIIGKVRSILRNPIYTTLGFARGAIMNRDIEQVIIAKADNINDILNSVFGRVIFRVVAWENENLIEDPIICSQINTQIVLWESDLGLYYELIEQNLLAETGGLLVTENNNYITTENTNT